MPQSSVIIEGFQTSSITKHIRHINYVYIAFMKTGKYTCVGLSINNSTSYVIKNNIKTFVTKLTNTQEIMLEAIN